MSDVYQAGKAVLESVLNTANLGPGWDKQVSQNRPWIVYTHHPSGQWISVGISDGDAYPTVFARLLQANTEHFHFNYGNRKCMTVSDTTSTRIVYLEELFNFPEAMCFLGSEPLTDKYLMEMLVDNLAKHIRQGAQA